LRTGVFGGAFNPPHVGHLVCAQEAFWQLGLDSVLWIPVGRAPHRDVPRDPGPEVRLRMCERAIAGDERFELSRIEVDRAGPSYTADTLRALRERAPGDELVLILGGDQAAALPSWHEPEAVAALATIAVAERGESDRTRVESALAGYDARLELFDMPRIDVSSTLVRERAAAGRPIRYLVPDGVADLIRERGLYGASVPA
jgi:nicotinate-nucleotide adenylyltransferase